MQSEARHIPTRADRSAVAELVLPARVAEPGMGGIARCGAARPTTLSLRFRKRDVVDSSGFFTHKFSMSTLSSTHSVYSLATGEAAVRRLQSLHSVYGPKGRRVLTQAGLVPGMRVADFGCGVGVVTRTLAEMVGPSGHVTGIDVSGAQLGQAREHCADGGFANAAFVEASATATGLSRESRISSRDSDRRVASTTRCRAACISWCKMRAFRSWTSKFTSRRLRAATIDSCSSGRSTRPVPAVSPPGC
jgi:hypothetical protein